eukprot:scaffold50891_cov63-Phaeocystis_antarctica.AAC.3
MQLLAPGFPRGRSKNCGPLLVPPLGHYRNLLKRLTSVGASVGGRNDVRKSSCSEWQHVRRKNNVSPPSAAASTASQPPSPPPPSPKPPCATPVDFALVLDESGSMKRYMYGAGGLKAFAKQLVNMYFLGVDAARLCGVLRDGCDDAGAMVVRRGRDQRGNRPDNGGRQNLDLRRL